MEIAHVLITLMVAGYIAIAIGSFLVAVQSYRQPLSFWGRHGFWIRLLVLAEGVYALQAPACLYLPYVPGRPAIQREIVGVDSSQRVHWLETERRLSFAWGPRWWLAASGHVLDGGAEFLPGLRFARPKPSSVVLVRADGARRPFPLGGGELWARGLWFVNHEGTFVGLGRGGLYTLPESEGSLRLVAPVEPWLRDWSLEGLCKSDHGSVEAYEASRPLIEKGRQRQILLVERNQAGHVIRRSPLSLEEGSPDVIGSRGRGLALSMTSNGMLLFQTWVDKSRSGQGRIYLVTEDLSRFEPRGSFEFDPLAHLSIAASSDGAFFTTGQAVLRIAGQKAKDLEPPLKWCHWVGHVLYGVRECPLFGALVQNRSVPFRQFVDVAASPQPLAKRAADQQLRAASNALQRSRGFMGGIDEAGCEDEIVQVSVQ